MRNFEILYYAMGDSVDPETVTVTPLTDNPSYSSKGAIVEFQTNITRSAPDYIPSALSLAQNAQTGCWLLACNSPNDINNATYATQLYFLRNDGSKLVTRTYSIPGVTTYFIAQVMGWSKNTFIGVGGVLISSRWYPARFIFQGITTSGSLVEAGKLLMVLRDNVASSYNAVWTAISEEKPQYPYGESRPVRSYVLGGYFSTGALARTSPVTTYQIVGHCRYYDDVDNSNGVTGFITGSSRAYTGASTYGFGPGSVAYGGQINREGTWQTIAMTSDALTTRYSATSKVTTDFAGLYTHNGISTDAFDYSGKVFTYRSADNAYTYIVRMVSSLIEIGKMTLSTTGYSPVSTVFKKRFGTSAYSCITHAEFRTELSRGVARPTNKWCAFVVGGVKVSASDWNMFIGGYNVDASYDPPSFSYTSGFLELLSPTSKVAAITASDFKAPTSDGMGGQAIAFIRNNGLVSIRFNKFVNGFQFTDTVEWTGTDTIRFEGGTTRSYYSGDLTAISTATTHSIVDPAVPTTTNTNEQYVPSVSPNATDVVYSLIAGYSYFVIGGGGVPPA